MKSFIIILTLLFCCPSYAATANIAFYGVVPVKACSVDNYLTSEEINKAISEECKMQIEIFDNTTQLAQSLSSHIAIKENDNNPIIIVQYH
ncbi:hypothetical protein [Shewanella baltica]|uniref:hypothetical protein n=1 Tax=Shewanella baltica TaxID=62322 RepID=UPI003CFED07A